MRIILRLTVSTVMGLFLRMLIDFLAIRFGFEGYMTIMYNYNYIVVIVITALFYFVCSKKFFDWLDGLIAKLSKMYASELLIICAGLSIGLIIANLISGASSNFFEYSNYIRILLCITLGYMGYVIAFNKRNELRISNGKLLVGSSNSSAKPKVIDTSVIIDGRILDVLKTGFIEGTVIIPSFVLEELRHIADSSDNLKRGRGRLGLDVLNKIQDLDNVPIEIMDYDGEQDIEVDIKLLKLAEQLGAYVVTNDYNLNKVAGIHKVPVLNINDLSNAVKSIILPGQNLNLYILKEGKESEQGIGYLNDGTMIVVEGSRKFIGQSIEIIVTSALQTSAGRMIFGKPKEENEYEK